ncbi:MAG: hypothetical protein K5662_02255 [Lachnospiraceae bacterium]|nr:hypothetical protein [Lachnospiraceae bacterium]
MNAGWCYGSASESVSITNYETVFDLEGYGSAGSINYGMLPKHYGVDLVMDGDGAPKGIGGSYGYGFSPLCGHLRRTYTKRIAVGKYKVYPSYSIWFSEIILDYLDERGVFNKIIEERLSNGK